LLRHSDDQPSIGLILSKTKNHIGISEYRLAESLPEKLQGSLPTVEELESTRVGNRRDILNRLLCCTLERGDRFSGTSREKEMEGDKLNAVNEFIREADQQAAAVNGLSAPVIERFRTGDETWDGAGSGRFTLARFKEDEAYMGKLVKSFHSP